MHKRMMRMCCEYLDNYEADQKKQRLTERLAKNKAEADAILESWKAGKEKDQALVAKIKTEAAPRDEIRLAQLAEQDKQKREEEAELVHLGKEMKKAQRKSAREMEKLNKIFRKDMRERNRVHVSSTNRSPSRSRY